MRTRRTAKLEAAASCETSTLTRLKGRATETSLEGGQEDETVGHVSSEKEGGHVSGEEDDGEECPVLPDMLTLRKIPRSLCSSLDPGPQQDLYFSCDPNVVVDSVLPPRTLRSKVGSNIGRRQDMRKDYVITSDFEQKECAPPIKVSSYARKKAAKVYNSYSSTQREGGVFNEGVGSMGSIWETHL